MMRTSRRVPVLLLVAVAVTLTLRPELLRRGGEFLNLTTAQPKLRVTSQTLQLGSSVAGGILRTFRWPSEANNVDSVAFGLSDVTQRRSIHTQSVTAIRGSMTSPRAQLAASSAVSLLNDIQNP